ncbi:MAG: class I SAM-dependent methyltransferase [Gammaproteobacteria bacterium]
MGNGVRYPPQQIRDGLHRLVFYLAAALGPRFQHAFLRSFFALKYKHVDPWSFDATPYQAKHFANTLALIPKRSYRRALEIGCGEGTFSLRLLQEREILEFIGLDISPNAIQRATIRCTSFRQARFCIQNILKAQPRGPFDLIVIAETLYYLGDTVSFLAETVARLLYRKGTLVLVDPWPDAEALHAHFVQHAMLTRLQEAVHEDSLRPFCVSTLQRTL